MTTTLTRPHPHRADAGSPSARLDPYAVEATITLAEYRRFQAEHPMAQLGSARTALPKRRRPNHR